MVNIDVSSVKKNHPHDGSRLKRGGHRCYGHPEKLPHILLYFSKNTFVFLRQVLNKFYKTLFKTLKPIFKSYERKKTLLPFDFLNLLRPLLKVKFWKCMFHTGIKIRRVQNGQKLESQSIHAIQLDTRINWILI